MAKSKLLCLAVPAFSLTISRNSTRSGSTAFRESSRFSIAFWNVLLLSCRKKEPMQRSNSGYENTKPFLNEIRHFSTSAGRLPSMIASRLSIESCPWSTEFFLGRTSSSQ